MQVLLPYRYRWLRRVFRRTPFRLLDIGCGNHSATTAQKFFPQVEYHGLDLVRDYNNAEEDMCNMAAFYEVDLSTLKYDAIPDDYFDAIVLAHVIEHIPNGELAIAALMPKLKKGGVIYVEYPSLKSTKLPSCRGCLNFFDDSSHIRLYSLFDLSNLMAAQRFKILSSGYRRSWLNIVLMPMKIAVDLLRKGYVEGNVFWDLLGFAEYIVARKR